MHKMLVFIGILPLFWLITPSSAQRLPAIACPQYFEYLSFNRQFIGHISVRHDPQNPINELVAEFSQLGAYEWSHVGSLSLLDDEETTKLNVRNGNPINYRVDFPLPSSPPKLTQIRLNNVVLCQASQYQPPKTAISLMHVLRTSNVPLGFFDTSRIPGGVNPQWPQFTQTVQPAEPIQPQEPEQPFYYIEQPPVTQRATTRQRPVAVQPSTNFGSRAQPTAVPAAEQPLSSICGRERALTTPLIFQGQQLQRGQLPWLVGLFEQKTDLLFFCGGTLLSSWTVLSAAHCFRFPGRDLLANQTVVSLGRNTIDVVSEGMLREVSQLLYHDEYKFDSIKADLVLIRMATQVMFNDYIVPICLWNEQYPAQLPSGYKTYVAGWGADENANLHTKFSKITSTNIVTDSNCRSELQVTDLVQSDSICAKRAGAGPCASDGGGGLMLRENNIWLLRGVISIGLHKDNTCDLSKPSIYVDVAKHIAWLRRNMWE